MRKRLKELRGNERERANVAVAKEHTKTALNGSFTDNVRRVTRAASGTMKKQESENEEIQHDLVPERDLLKETAMSQSGYGPKDQKPTWQESVPFSKQKKGENSATSAP